MDMVDRLKLRTGETNEFILLDCVESAKAAILSRRFPFGDWPDSVESQYSDLQYRIALDLYNKQGAEGELSHTDGSGVSRSYESSWISEQLLSEVIPKVGTRG
jgi:hypothetical protein